MHVNCFGPRGALMGRGARSPLTSRTALHDPGPSRSRGSDVLALLLASLLPLLAGCASLLPTSRSEIVSTWGSYEEAVQALGTLRAYQATRADVHAIGLDPRSNPAITVLHFADMLQRFSTAPLLERERLDAGMRDCLLAGRQCTGYAVSVRKIERVQAWKRGRLEATAGVSAQPGCITWTDQLGWRSARTGVSAT